MQFFYEIVFLCLTIGRRKLQKNINLLKFSTIVLISN